MSQGGQSTPECIQVLLVHERSTSKMERYNEVACSVPHQREVVRSIYIERDALRELAGDDFPPRLIEVTIQVIDPDE